ncbi:Uncharacterised protein [uncultured archaeon]|nr:Uncharacterised protein [uncultured archaeon]
MQANYTAKGRVFISQHPLWHNVGDEAGLGIVEVLGRIQQEGFSTATTETNAFYGYDRASPPKNYMTGQTGVKAAGDPGLPYAVELYSLMETGGTSQEKTTIGDSAPGEIGRVTVFVPANMPEGIVTETEAQYRKLLPQYNLRFIKIGQENKVEQ